MRLTGTLDLDGSTIKLDQGGNATTITSNSPAGDITLTLPATTDTIPGIATSNTFTNKTLGDTNTINAQTDAFTIDDAAAATKQVDFAISGATASTKTTLTFAQTANRVVTYPDATDTLVGKATTDTLTNKTLGDTNTINAQTDAFTIDDSADGTKQIDFSLSGATTGAKVTIAHAATTDRTITIPDATDTLVGKATTDTLTNKTIGDSNTIAAQSDAFTINDAGGGGQYLDFAMNTATGGTHTTFNFVQTAPRDLTFPDATDTLVGRATTDTLTNKSIDSDNNTITNIVNADIKAAAAIALNKLAATTISRALVSDASGFITAATTTSTEIGYVNGVTSAIQTQLDAKLDDFSSTTDNALVRTNGTAGAAVQDSGILIDDSDNISAIANLTMTGNLTVDTNTLYVDATNNRVGIKTTAPDVALHIEGAGGAAAERMIIDSTLTYTDGANPTIEVRDNGGTVGLVGGFKHSGITNAAGYIQLRSGDSTFEYVYVGDDNELKIDGTATNIGTNSGTVVGDQVSDERLKENIAPLQYGLAEVLQLQPISYVMFGKNEIGFGAQTTAPIIPEAVYNTNSKLNIEDENSPSDKLAMKYSRIIPVLVNAIKELEARLAVLEGA